MQGQRAATPIAVAVLIISAVVLMGCFERRCEEYANYETAHANGAVTRGWLPEGVPHDASEIRLCSDLDTGETRISFRLNSESLSRLEAANGGVAGPAHWVRRFPVAGWWPKELEGNLKPGSTTVGGLEIFALDVQEVNGRRLGFAVDRGGRIVYMWRLPS